MPSMKHPIKSLKKLLLYTMLLCLLLPVAPPPVLGVKVVEAASVKKGLVKENGKYYYYADGVKVKKKLVRVNASSIYYFGSNGSAVTNTFKNLKDTDGKKYRFYFGPAGKAVVAKKVTGQQKNMVIKKINGVSYGFDTLGHVTTGMWVNAKGTLFYFEPNGAYNAAKTKPLRSAIKKYYGKKPTSETGYKNVYSYLKKALGSHKVLKGSSCMIWGNTNDGYTDVTMRFTNFEILLIMNNRTKQYYFYDIYSR